MKTVQKEHFFVQKREFFGSVFLVMLLLMCSSKSNITPTTMSGRSTCYIAIKSLVLVVHILQTRMRILHTESITPLPLVHSIYHVPRFTATNRTAFYGINGKGQSCEVYRNFQKFHNVNCCSILLFLVDLPELFAFRKFNHFQIF